MQAARVLVTGGAGFIGSHLVQAMAGKCDIFVFDNLSERAHKNTPDNIGRVRQSGARFLFGDIRNADALANAVALSRPDIVVHLAAETGTGESFDQPSKYCQVNVDGTANLIEALRSTGCTKRVILASTRAVYGEGAYVYPSGKPAMAVARSRRDLQAGVFTVHDKDGIALIPAPTSSALAPAPVSIYASTKLMQEHMLAQAFWGSGTEVCAMRFQNVFGPSQSLWNPYTGVLSKFAACIAENAILDIFEDGGITRDFLYVTDAALALCHAIEATDLPPVLDIGSGIPTTIYDVACAMLAQSGKSKEMARVSGNFRPGDIRHALADVSAARKALNWHPQITLKTGLSNLLGWSAEQVAA